LFLLFDCLVPIFFTCITIVLSTMKAMKVFIIAILLTIASCYANEDASEDEHHDEDHSEEDYDHSRIMDEV